ncbi:hypothetical protein [Micromonospora sp. DT233]|uniref:hypothetical protein n=1 Tax=Micromonospora sp. DT233 TaxID=3393432 RepID=UPI003CEDE54E
MAPPPALPPRLPEQRGALGDRRDQVLALLRARGLRFRDGSRWRLPTMPPAHPAAGRP